MTGSRSAIITGGFGQIGDAIATELLESGLVDQIWCLDSRVPDVGTDPRVRYIQVDLSGEQEMEQVRAQLPDRICMLINAVGGERRPSVAAVQDKSWPPSAVWDDITVLNMGLPYRVTERLHDRIEDGGTICNISSIAAGMPWVVSPAYGAAKAALEHWGKSLAVVLAPRGIRVNAVRPGFVWSRQWAEVSRQEFDEVVRDRVPLAQVSTGERVSKEQTPGDIAKVVAFLCSSAAKHLTGQTLDVDGGAALARAPR
ncbi:SDR family oxidoreductase [Arthrobacter sp. ISL-48]|uniref:SDR family NAD(P)-dependent oxidoreductase n=1 Tax=Arthrobacter sp. ISL-48 TaxID=2819110 RepID=UPI001BE55406|nr:SDR family oxidoreductase [Arthrobacter sp. ISL-48]MBT2533970.1 SDR family oxidoreductase [Arthrobacter sp. ISL-48]